MTLNKSANTDKEHAYVLNSIITGPPSHSVGEQYCFALGRLSSSVTLHGGLAGGFTRACQSTTSCRLQSNYISTVTLHGGPVVLHPVRATPYFVAVPSKVLIVGI